MKSILFLMMGLFLVGCAGKMEPTAVVVEGVETAVFTPTPPPSPTKTPIPATKTPSPTIPPSPLPPSSPAPLPAIALVAAPEWQDEAGEAVAALNAGGSAWQWWLTDGVGDITLEKSDHSAEMLVHADPIALVVPFTDRLEAITLAEAETILADGHRAITPLLWRDMPPTHKPLRVDGLLPSDADYPLQERWVLRGSDEAAMVVLQPVLAGLMVDEVVRITAVGDIMLDRYLGEKIAVRGQIEYPFAKMLDIFAGADLLTGNFESALGDVGEPADKIYQFQSPPEAAQTLANAGFDLVTLANNHALDYGADALLQGIGLLHGQGVATVGAGMDEAAARAAYITQTNGLTIASVGFVHVPIEGGGLGFDTESWTATADAPGLAWGAPETIAADVAALAATEPDLIVVHLHSGYEYIEEPSLEQVAAAQAAIDAGADVVIGHHAHILQGVEYYNGGVIVYGLGNFAFHIDGEPKTAVMHIWLDADGVRQLELVPAIVQEGGAPRPADAEEAAAIRERVYWLTDIVNYPSPWRELKKR